MDLLANFVVNLLKALFFRKLAFRFSVRDIGSMVAVLEDHSVLIPEIEVTDYSRGDI